MHMVAFFVADWIIDYFFFYLPFIARKVLAIELTQLLFVEPARQWNRRIKARETLLVINKIIQVRWQLPEWRPFTHHFKRERKLELKNITTFNLYLSLFLTTMLCDKLVRPVRRIKYFWAISWVFSGAKCFYLYFLSWLSIFLYLWEF